MARLAQLAVLVSCFIVTYTFPKGDNATTAHQSLTSTSTQSTTKDLNEEHKIVNGTKLIPYNIIVVKDNPCPEGYFRDWMKRCRELD
ncbi:unnamed protein product [Callosobruchus maculatus]|uniref:Uncharacterized protein n=1 Tax=Callosobruchus maculatus TaxID=64391 RepID=A0A653CAH4_CALMS|nr:unnamed protein product [Callosobruchus maculatus]